MFLSLLKSLGSPSGAQDDQDAVGREQRDTVRHETSIEATLSFLGRDYLCVIRNVSSRGMTIEAQGVPLCVGVQIVARCAFGRVFCGTIRWHRDGAFGMQFVRPLSTDQIQDVRRHVPEGMNLRAGRARLRIPAVARFADQCRRIEILNLSVGGLQMAAEGGLQAGQSMMIEFLDLLPIGGHIRWSQPGRCGVMFSKLLPLGVAEDLTRRGALPESWLDEVRAAHELSQAA